MLVVVMFIKRLMKKKFTKYVVISLSSFLVDIMFFNLLYFFLNPYFSDISIILSTILARLISSLYNYFLNSRLVFKKYSKKIMAKYLSLVIINTLVSAFTVYVLKKACSESYAGNIKIVVDCLIFMINYVIQRKVVYR